MGIFDGFPFTSKRQQQEDQQALEERVFPFGQAQRRAALLVLQNTVQRKSNDAEKLFCFITAKDRYVRGGQDADALEDAAAALLRLRWLPRPDIRRVLALVLLDTVWNDSDPYPTVQAVEALLQTASFPKNVEGE